MNKTAKKTGRPPKESAERRTVGLSLTVTKDFHERIVKQAERERRPVASMCVLLIERAMEAEAANASD